MVQELGISCSARALHDLVKREVPQLVFLMEARLSSFEFEYIKRRIGFPLGLIVDSSGKAGGIGPAMAKKFSH
ncbi:unnamed protein product [Ilex paraguariensis]|uniref:Uncharacterized protein n=1 Tax=Ilex paraguariensis TaxID=185542 RepID=A0ABC8RC39_9AQUA